MKQKKWVVWPRQDEDLWRHLLLSRELKSEEEQEAFFQPSLAGLVSPWDFPEMEVAVERIGRAIEAGERVVVWGDFDCDGVSSTAILWETLHGLGAKVMPYIPNRDTEGHGFNEAALQKMADEGVTLIVTCDHGVTAFEEVRLAKELGMEVVVSDHHEPAWAGGADDGTIRRLAEPDGTDDKMKVRRRDGEEVGIQTSNFNPDSIGVKLPDCVAVIHPFRLKKPQQLAGCGVAYQLAYGVWLKATARRHDGTKVERQATSEVTEGFLGGEKGSRQVGAQVDEPTSRRADDVAAREEFAKGRIELAALGTIADLMPLTGNNRILAAFGLRALAKTHRPGLQELMRAAGMKPDKAVSVYEVGFLIAPRLNAPGRLADGLESLRLLCSRDLRRAHELARNLDNLNRQRQVLLEKVLAQAREAALAKPVQGAYVLSNPDWPAGVCGLAAGRLVEMVYRPVVVMEEQGEMSRGSARSIKGFDITAGLASIRELLQSYGGHAMAAGFVCKTENIPEIERRLGELVEKQMDEEGLQPRLDIDAEVKLNELTEGLWQKLQQLEPCGLGNPQPVFVGYGLEVTGCRTMGNGEKHLKLTLAQAARRQGGTFASEVEIHNSHPRTLAPSQTFEAVAFGFGDRCEGYLEAGLVDVVFCLEENVWNGRRFLQLKVKDIRVSE